MARLNIQVLGALAGALAVTACGQGDPSGTSTRSAGGDGAKIVSQVTTQMDVPAGEAWVMTDPRNPQNVMVVWLSVKDTEEPIHLLTVPGYCGVAVSNDGGRTWSDAAKPFGDSHVPICGDPVGGVGPDGTVYVGVDNLVEPSWTEVIGSSDWGATWSPPAEIFGVTQMALAALANLGHPTPAIAVGRQYMAVDPLTGEVSVNSQEDGGVEGRWLTVSSDRGATWSVPRPLDPGIQSNTAGPHSAAGGTIAVAYNVDPGSLDYQLFPAVDCAAPCTVFETTTDQGVTWTRHVMPNENVPANKIVAADPSRPGRFAVLFTTNAGSTLEIWLTPDGGANWTQTKALTAESGDAFTKPWLAYGPSGALGAFWRLEHADGSTLPSVIIARDGGNTFSDVIPLIAAPTAPDPRQLPGDDCACNLHLDATTLSATWTDTVTGQRQMYYGRIDYTSVPAAK